VVEELTPFLNGAIGDHHRGTGFVPAKDDLQQAFPGLGWEGLDAKIINDEQVGLEPADVGALGFEGRGVGLQPEESERLSRCPVALTAVAGIPARAALGRAQQEVDCR